MYNEIRSMYIDAKQVHHILFKDLQGLEDKFKASKLAERVDIVYGLQKTSEMLNEIRKQIDKVSKSLGTRVCMEMEVAGLRKLKTEHCTASVKVENFANLPHKREKDPEKFDTLMASLGVPSEVSQIEGVRFHWPGFKEYLTNQVAQGNPIPPGISPDDLYTEYTLATRKVMEPDE